MKRGMVWLGLAGILFAVLLVYSQHFHSHFHLDDVHTIVNNAYIRDLQNIPLFFKDGRTFSSQPANQSYRPLLTTTLAVDYHITGGLGDTFVYHCTSFAIFIGLGICLFFLFRRVYRLALPDASSDIPALLATSWFMLHPISAETVNYLIQRGDLMATFFIVLTFVMYLYSGIARRYFLYILPLTAAIFTKPIAVTFPLLMTAYIWLFERDIRAKTGASLKKTYIVHLLITFVIVIAVAGFVLHMTPDSFQTAGGDTMLYRISQPYILGRYFMEWFAPLRLAADVGIGVLSSPFSPLALLGYFFIAFLISTVIYTSRRSHLRPIAFGLSWYLIANLVTCVIPLEEVAADHRMFLSCIGLSMAITWGLYLVARALAGRFAWIGGARPVILVMVVGGVLCYAYGTYVRCQVWQTEEALWSDAVSKYPASIRSHLNYGLALMRRSALAEAEKQFASALAIAPDQPYANMDMGIIKHLQHKDDEVESFLHHALDYGSQSCAPCYYYYAMYMNEHGRIEDAIKLLYTEYRMSDSDIPGRELLMELLYKAHRADELRQIIAAVLLTTPSDPQALHYKDMLSSSQLVPAPPKTIDTYINLSGQAYREGRYQDCIDHALKALEIDSAFAPAYNNLAAAYNKLQKYSQAKDASLKSLQLDPGSRFAKVNLDIAEKGMAQTTAK